MKLSEIRQALEQAFAAHDPATTPWDNYPRVNYMVLPASLQKMVRERYKPEDLRAFIEELYPDNIEGEPIPDDYKSFSEMVEGVPEPDLAKIFLKARNNAIYTIEYDFENHDNQSMVPCLYANHASGAFQWALHEYQNTEHYIDSDGKRHRKYKTQPNSRTSIASPGTEHLVVTAGFYQHTISDKEFKHALSPYKNRYGYVSLMTSDFFDKFTFENGVIQIDQQNVGTIQRYAKNKYEDIKAFDAPLFAQIYTAASNSHAQQQHGDYTVTVNLPQFAKEMGMKHSREGLQELLQSLHSFENYVGVSPERQFVAKLFTILEIDWKNQTMTFAAPYIMRLFSILDKKHLKETKKGDYILPYESKLKYSTIVKERNKAAVDLLDLILKGLNQRGTTPDSKTWSKTNQSNITDPDIVTYRITCKTLVENSTLLRIRLQEYEESNGKTIAADQNKLLKRAFTKMYELLDAQTDASAYYLDFKVKKVVPTMTTLDQEIIITHKGIDSKYQKKHSQ